MKVIVVVFGVLISAVMAASTKVQSDKELITTSVWTEETQQPEDRDKNKVLSDFKAFSSGVFKYNLSKPQSHKLEDLLENLFKFLKSFLNKAPFDFQEFQSHVNRVDKEILELEYKLDDLYDQIYFIKNMFLSMTESVETLSHYRIPNPQEEMFLKKMVEIKIMTLGLQNLHGDLDLTDASVFEKFVGLRRVSAFCEKKFYSFENVLDELMLKFDQETRKVKKVLDNLEQQLPNHEVL